jgi:lipopolysaccharide transport protein LptA
MEASRLVDLFAVALACTAAVPIAHGAQQFSTSKTPISVKADSTDVDFKSGKTLLSNVSISQGEISIKSDRAAATGMDFEDSRWEFTGNVKIVAEKKGTLQSDSAVVEFHNNRFVKATAKGNPAQFEQRRDAAAEQARGRAAEIVYEVDAGTVRFSKDAWLSNGANEISGPVLVYNIRDQKVGGQGVQITIVPKEGGKPTVVKPQTPEGSSTP